MKMYGKKTIIFDWDGTLFDSMTYKRENIAKIFTEIGADGKKVILLHHKLSGIPRRELFMEIYKILFQNRLTKENYNYLSRKYTELNIKSSFKSRLFDDVEPALNYLSANYLLFISSSSEEEELLQIVKKQGISEMFQGIYGSKSAFNKGIEHFSFIQSNWSLNKEDILFVGDDEQDIKLSAISGVDVVCIMRNDGHIENTSCPYISSLLELGEIL